MPKLLCINDDWSDIVLGVTEAPKYLEECDAIDIIKCCCGCGMFGYQLNGYDSNNLYDVNHFVELDGPDELEIKKKRGDHIGGGIIRRIIKNQPVGMKEQIAKDIELWREAINRADKKSRKFWFSNQWRYISI